MKFTLVFSAEDVRDYAKLSGDCNPIHLDKEAAQAAGFPRPVVHGLFVAATIVNRLADRLPEPLQSDFSFQAPVVVGESVEVEIIESASRWQVRAYSGGRLAIRGKLYADE